jgi:hypothetical protein
MQRLHTTDANQKKFRNEQVGTTSSMPRATPLWGICPTARQALLCTPVKVFCEDSSEARGGFGPVF